jgi:hypothetical protein
LTAPHPNPIRHRISVGLQWTGLVGAVAGLIATPLFLGFAAQWLIAGGIAVALDVVAVRTDADVKAMLAALGKLVVLVTALVAFTTAGSIPAMVPGTIPPDTGPALLLLSILPSELGAILRRTPPMPEMGVPQELQR